MSTYNVVKPGLANAGSYQVSGIPWASSSITVPASGSVLEISFPYVTRSIVIKNTDGNVKVRVGFSENGVLHSNNYFELGKGESYADQLRVSRIYVMSDTAQTSLVSLVCGLTGIPASELPTNWSGSSGVG